MRHKNFYTGRLGFHTRHNDYLSSPYSTVGSPHLEYKRPSMTRIYCKIVQWIADHPDCSRKAAIVGVFFGKRMRKLYEERVTPGYNGWSPEAKVKFRGYLEKWDHGDFSWVKYNPSRYFAELLWADLIDYDTKTFKYNVTDKGHKLLEKAYLNDNIKSVTGKFPWQK